MMSPARDRQPAGALRPALRDETACALCGRREYVVVGRIDRHGRPLRTVMCRMCGLVWTNPRPTDADMDRYYATGYRADYTRQATPSRRKLLRGFLGAGERLASLGPLIGSGVRLLDVGCGAGELVYLLRQRGVEASGIEPGEAYADFSRQVLGVSIQTATVDTALVPPGSQDVITMFHVLEHVPDPRRVLARVREWLARDGRLVVEVPNVESTVQAPRHRFHFAHLYSFNPDTLGALGETAGLSVVRSELSADGGNVTCVFARGGPAPWPVARLDGNVERMTALFERHTTLRHYLTRHPYVRAGRRLARRWREDRLLARLPTVEEVVAWASRSG